VIEVRHAEGPKAEVLRRLAVDRPSFNYVGAADAERAASLGLSVQAGDANFSVGARTLEKIAGMIGPDDVTIETGAGYTTVVCATLARHHYCVTAFQREADRISDYLAAGGVPPGKVSFFIGSSDRTLPALNVGPVDFVYVDGCHGYPYPMLDWHYLDKLLKVGGILGMDNAELRPVREHCHYLEAPGSGYTLLERVTDGCFVRFYRKEQEQYSEWINQPWSRALREPSRRSGKIKYRVRSRISRWLRPYLY
jgi:predicted O-methyltransferase YrrM